jgi:hypothetical protein
MKRLLKYAAGLLGALLLLLGGPLLLAASSSLEVAESWRTASRESAGIAPLPDQVEEAIIQVYGARAWSWRGYFAVHTWIATKEQGADYYQVHEVTGWRNYVVNSRPGDPDRHWYGARPDMKLRFINTCLTHVRFSPTIHGLRHFWETTPTPELPCPKVKAWRIPDTDWLPASSHPGCSATPAASYR